jgi:hypothetical protein
MEKRFGLSNAGSNLLIIPTAFKEVNLLKNKHGHYFETNTFYGKIANGKKILFVRCHLIDTHFSAQDHHEMLVNFFV